MTQASRISLEPVQPKYTDAWGGYQPSKMRHRRPWPEICSCMAHGKPHRHAVCEVDEGAKVPMMAGVLQRLCGYEGDPDPPYTKVILTAEVNRVARALWGFVDLCNKLNSTRNGVSGAGLRKVLQTWQMRSNEPPPPSDPCDDSGPAAPVQGKCRLGLHEIDFLTSEGCRHRMIQREHPASAKMALFPLFDMMLEVSRRCCDKDPLLTGAAPIEKLEWLLEALRPGLEASTSSSTAPYRRGGSVRPAAHASTAQQSAGRPAAWSKAEAETKEPGPLLRVGRRPVATPPG